MLKFFTVLVLTIGQILSLCALPSNNLIKDEAKGVAERADVKSFIGKISEHIGKIIEERERDGSLRDENDPLAIMLSSVTKLREEIEQKAGVDLGEEEEEAEHPGMPKGMKDVNPTASTKASLATSLSILFANPETLKSLNDKMVDDSTFQDYINLAESQDPELRKQSQETIRRRTLEVMRQAFKIELRKLAFVFIARWTDSLQKQAATGNFMALILFHVQELVMKHLVDLIVDAMANHSTKVVQKLSEFARGIRLNEPSVPATASSRFGAKPGKLEEDDDKGQWMLRYMID